MKVKHLQTHATSSIFWFHVESAFTFSDIKNASIVPPALLPPAPLPGPWPLLPPHYFYSLASAFSVTSLGKKITYFNYVSELREYLEDDQLTIPPEVLR